MNTEQSFNMALVVYREQRIRSGTLCVTHYSAILFDLKMVACMGPETANSRDLAFYCRRNIVEISIQSTSETFFQSNCVLWLIGSWCVAHLVQSVPEDTKQHKDVSFNGERREILIFLRFPDLWIKINFNQIFESIGSLMVFGHLLCLLG